MNTEFVWYSTNFKLKNNIPPNKIKHNIKITVGESFNLTSIENVKLKIGYGESVMQIYKTKMDIEFERKHICEVIMKKCVHCGIINHTRFNCPEFNKQKTKKGDEVEKAGFSKQRKDYRQKMR